jgi:hypothetical protein
MTRCFLQSRVQKSTHPHKGCNWLTSRKYYGSTSTKTLRLIIIGFDNLTDDNGNGNKDNDILAIISLTSDNSNAGKGRGGGSYNCRRRPPQGLATELLLPPPPAMAPRTSATYPALLPPSPPTTPLKSIASFPGCHSLLRQTCPGPPRRPSPLQADQQCKLRV